LWRHLAATTSKASKTLGKKKRSFYQRLLRYRALTAGSRQDSRQDDGVTNLA